MCGRYVYKTKTPAYSGGFCFILERVRGIGPLSSAWKAEVIPVYDTRLNLLCFSIYIKISDNNQE